LQFIGLFGLKKLEPGIECPLRDQTKSLSLEKLGRQDIFCG